MHMSIARLILHAGAGPRRAEDREQEVREVLAEALEAGRRRPDAVRACLAAVEVMEEMPLLNAGRGSAPAADGNIYMDASAMDSEGRAGAVCSLSVTRNPSRAAAGLMDDPVILWAGREEELIEKLGLQAMEEEWFKCGPRHQGSGTVGAVALDEEGRLCAITSTGGITGKPPARVGDSAIIGAGTWCSEKVAVSCTGAGEAFILSAAAFQVERRLGDGLEASVGAALRDAERAGGLGGIIAVSSSGEVAALRSEESMQWACLDGGHISFGS